jgi:hypothetical protein
MPYLQEIGRIGEVLSRDDLEDRCLARLHGLGSSGHYRKPADAVIDLEQLQSSREL